MQMFKSTLNTLYLIFYTSIPPLLTKNDGQGGHDARQGQSRAVEGVAEAGFLVGSAVAAFQTAT